MRVEIARRSRSFLAPAILAFFCLAVSAAPAAAFALLGFQSIDQEPVRWSPASLADGISYSIQGDFLDDTGRGMGPFSEKGAVRNAFMSWNFSNWNLRLKDARYQPVLNSDDNFTGATRWEGSASSGGMGANIDVFSRPADFTYEIFGQTIGFGPKTLAFTLPIFNVLTGELVSVDIVFNEGFDYSRFPRGDQFQFDIQSVALHEIGHALGLDHPDQADDYGRNYDPITLQPVDATGREVMGSTISPGEISRMLTLDEWGGMRFLYGGSRKPFIDFRAIIGGALPRHQEGEPIYFASLMAVEASDKPIVTPEPATLLMAFSAAAALAGFAARRLRKGVLARRLRTKSKGGPLREPPFFHRGGGGQDHFHFKPIFTLTNAGLWVYFRILRAYPNNPAQRNVIMAQTR